MKHMTEDIQPLFDFVNLTHRAQEMRSSHRIYFSKRLYDLCQEQPFDDEDGLDCAGEIIEVLDANLYPNETFPALLWSHDWRPCIHRLPDDDGRVRLYLTLFNETRAGAALMVEYCNEILRFHEYVPGRRKPDGPVRVFFSDALRRRCKQRGKQIGNPDIEREIFHVASFLNDSAKPSFSWFWHNGFAVCKLQTLDADLAMHVYLMLRSECPAREVLPALPYRCL